MARLQAFESDKDGVIEAKGAPQLLSHVKFEMTA